MQDNFSIFCTLDTNPLSCDNVAVMNFVDGKAIALEIKKETAEILQNLKRQVSLDVYSASDSAVIDKYVKVKKAFAESISVKFEYKKRSSSLSSLDLAQEIKESVADGVVLQLPVFENLDEKLLIESIAKEKDVDFLKEESFVDFAGVSLEVLGELAMPPVAGAVFEILKRHKINAKGANVAVVGYGKLVGRPCKVLLEKLGANVEVLTRKSDKEKLKSVLRSADIVLSGAGVSSLIKKEMIKSGVILFDAGTSESGGVLQGDIDISCAEKASLFSKSPGGIGPVAVACLFKNLAFYARQSA